MTDLEIREERNLRTLFAALGAYLVKMSPRTPPNDGGCPSLGSIADPVRVSVWQRLMAALATGAVFAIVLGLSVPAPASVVIPWALLTGAVIGWYGMVIMGGNFTSQGGQASA